MMITLPNSISLEDTYMVTKQCFASLSDSYNPRYDVQNYCLYRKG